MVTWKVVAWVKDSPNTVPIATMTCRSLTLSYEIGKAMERHGFRVEMKEVNEYEIS